MAVRTSHGMVARKAARHDRSGGIFLDATEMYLRTVYEMQEESGRPPARQPLADRMDITRPSVVEQVKRLTLDGLLEVSPRGDVVLSEAGRRRASAVVRKHRLTERFLVDVVGLDWELAHVEAVRWQHVLGDRAERRIAALLGQPRFSPYGDPIPAVDGTPDPPRADDSLRGIDELAGPLHRRVRIDRLLDRLQSDPATLARCRTHGVVPGAEVEVVRSSTRGHVDLRGDVATLTLDLRTAGLLRARAADRSSSGPAPRPVAVGDHVRGVLPVGAP